MLQVRKIRRSIKLKERRVNQGSPSNVITDRVPKTSHLSKITAELIMFLTLVVQFNDLYGSTEKRMDKMITEQLPICQRNLHTQKKTTFI